jgi:SAM-dependent methyltransferase
VTRASIYDQIGTHYHERRRAEPRWQAAIDAALGGAASVINVGAGTGSYEPHDRFVVAIEPSATMIGRRSHGSAPVVRAMAEALPVAGDAFDAALTTLTIHHWSDPIAGLAEMRRVAGRQIVLTWDPAVTERFWLFDYLPEIVEHERGVATLSTVVEHIEVVTVEVLAVPFDCRDGVLGAYWRRPRAYLDPVTRSAISGIALLDDDVVQAGIARLTADLESGRWDARHADLEHLDELDLGYRLVVAGRV